MRQEPTNKPIASFWFYLFAVFFAAVGVADFVKATLEWHMRILGLVLFFVGVLFLLEPLDRKNRLPPRFSHFYLGVQKLFRPAQNTTPKGVKISLIVSLVGMIFIIAGLVYENGFLGSTWLPARIYAVGMFSMFALSSILGLAGVFLQERFGSYSGSSVIMQFLAGMGRHAENKSIRSVGIGVLISFLSIAGFFVSIWLPQGNIIGPVALIFMVFVSFGQLLIFSQEENVRIASEAELKTAHDMQLSLMPVSDPEISGFDISGSCYPALEVGGDYYDYVWLDQEKTKFGIAIADVSGKAMKAAMTAVMTSGMIYREIESNSTPRLILQEINRPMYLKTSRQVFTALSFGVIDISSKRLLFSNAGQMNPLLKRGSDVITLKVSGPHLPLGVIKDIEYQELSEQLQSGDILLFYTDGIPEAMNKNRELFGFERLEQFVHDVNTTSTAKEITDQLLEAVQTYSGTALQHDDMTVVVAKVQVAQA